MLPSEREDVARYQTVISVLVGLEETILNSDDREKVASLIQEYGIKIKQIQDKYS